MDLSIVVVNYHSYDDIQNNLASMIRHFEGFSYEVIIVNNDAEDKKITTVSDQYDFVKVLDHGINYGFGRACNAGVMAAQGKYICYLNPDIIILNNLLPLIKKLEEDETIGLIAPRLKNADGTIQRSCYEFPGQKNWLAFNFYFNRLFPRVKWWGNFPMTYFDGGHDAAVDWVSGAYMVLRKSVADQVGGFSPEFFMYSEDTDICWKIRDAGYGVLFCGDSEAIHIGGTSSSPKSAWQATEMAKSYLILWNKHYDLNAVKKLCRITRWGAMLKGSFWRLRKQFRRTARTDDLFYLTMSKKMKQMMNNGYAVPTDQPADRRTNNESSAYQL